MTAATSAERNLAAMPRLLMACSTIADGSGMMAAVAPLASQMARRGFDVRLVGPIGPSDRPITAGQADGVRIDVLRRRPFWPPPLADAWNAASRVVGFARDGGRAVVHVHGVWTAVNAAACLRSRTLGIPYVVSPHGMLLPPAMRRSGLKKRCALGTFVRRNLEAAALVHASSEAERDSVLAVAPAARTVVIPWGVSQPAVVQERVPALSSRHAACVGRILPIKGVADLVAAWAAVRPEGWNLKFVGPDPVGYARHLAALIAAYGLTDSVSIHPAVTQEGLMRLFHEIALVILPSHSENFGLVVAEAMVAGVPVITTMATPWAEIPRRRCGWWVADTPGGLTAAIAEACALPAEALEKMGSRGQAWMRKSFAWPVIASQFDAELYGRAQ